MKVEDYQLARDFLGSCRLTGQHHIFLRKNGFFLAPAIESHLESRLKANEDIAIADIACGNGIWTYVAAERYPQGKIYGYDISPEQFPPAWVRPKNIELGWLDLFGDEMPEELHGKFDVIHIRLVQSTAPGINDERMRKAFRNFLTILKPTGFLQWQDVVWPMINLHDPNSSNPLEPLNKNEELDYWKTMNDMLGGQPRRWKNWDWEATMRDEGFDYAETYNLPAIPETLHFESAYMMWVSQEFITTVRRKGGCDPDLIDKAEKELHSILENGKLFSAQMSTFVGHKQPS